MEEAALKIKLNSLAQELLQQYKVNLTSKGKGNGELVRSSAANITLNGTTYSIVLNLPDYWKYVEEGRRPGKFPPPDAIKKWITVKGILPREINGRLPSENQLSFLISRKIARDGIQPTNCLSDAIQKTNIVQRAEQVIADYLSQKVDEELKE